MHCCSNYKSLKDYLTPGMKNKFFNLIACLKGIPNLICLLVKCTWNSNDKQRHSLTLIGKKCKFRILNPYLQDIPKHILIVYSWKCSCCSTDKLYWKIEMSFFAPDLIKWKFRNLIAHLKHIKTYPRVSFV